MSLPARSPVVATAALAVAALAACAAPAPETTGPSSLTIAVPAQPPWIPSLWDPTAVNLYFPVNQSVYEPLVELDRDTFAFDPVLAESYEITDDRRSIEFTIRPDVTFVDGLPLDAEAVKETLDYVMEQETYWKATLSPYTPEFTVVDDMTLEIVTSRGIGFSFLAALAIMPVVSPAAWDDVSVLESGPLGTGPYLVDEWERGTSLTVHRNPDHWNPDAYPFDEISYLAFEDRVAGFNALQSGQVDAAALDPGMVAQAESAGLEISVGGGLVHTLVLTDPTGTITPALKDERVLQAISMSLDRAGIIDAIELGYGTVVSQVFVDGHPSHVDGGDDRYAYDVEAAKELLADAGYADGFDLRIVSASPRYDAIVAQSLTDIGIRVTIDAVPAGATVVTAEGYPMILTATGDQFWLNRLVKGTWNEALPGDETVIDLVDRIDNGSAGESSDAAAELGEYVLERGTYVPISRSQDTWATIAGVHVNLGIIAATPPLLSGFTFAG